MKVVKLVLSIHLNQSRLIGEGILPQKLSSDQSYLYSRRGISALIHHFSSEDDKQGDYYNIIIVTVQLFKDQFLKVYLIKTNIQYDDFSFWYKRHFHIKLYQNLEYLDHFKVYLSVS